MSVATVDDAYQRLYPEKHYDAHIESGVRPDGRVLGLARETTIGIDPIDSADGSVLVKIGKTTVMAGIKLEVMKPSDDSPEEGMLTIQVEMTPMCNPDTRPGRAPEKAHVLSQQLEGSLVRSGALDLKQLCIHKNCAAWALYCDVYILNDDGALADACLLAASSALASLQLPSVPLSEDGEVISPQDSIEAAGIGSIVEAKPLPMTSVPLSSTCGMRKGVLLADPSLEEELLMDMVITVVVDQDGTIIGLHKAGGNPVPDRVVQDCIEMARLRYQTQASLLAQELHNSSK